jgi:ubiquinone/menaquinone biosynthesis C-methylase UbiE
MSYPGPMASPNALEEVRSFWDRAACGEDLYLRAPDAAGYAAQLRKRYELEPYIEAFAAPRTTRGRQVLEIGVGLGADHQRFAENGALLTGIDLTGRAVDHVRHRFELLGLRSQLLLANAEQLPFHDQSFDIVYSWGVLHHSPDTARAVGEVHRVLRADGTARIMIYQRHSLVGYMLWIRYALLAGRPRRTLSDVFANHLESPGTKGYTRAEAQRLFASFDQVTVRTVLTHGDLLESDAGQRHRGPLLSLAKRLWPRWLFRHFMKHRGLFMLIEASKAPAAS